MPKNPFHEDLDDTFRGVRVRVHTASHTYEGWGGRWHYNDHAFVIYDAERDDGEQVGAVTVLHQPETVERVEPHGRIEEVPIEAIAPSPYDARSYDDADHEQFVKLTRERGHLLTFPTVRPLVDEEREADHDNDQDPAYEVVAGHRRFNTARQAGLDVIPVRVVDLDAWAAVERFVDDHIPIEGSDERYMYSQQAIDHALARLRGEWPDEKLRKIGPLAPYLKEKLASTRREGMRQGYLADGEGR
jgi:hypothetical protein